MDENSRDQLLLDMHDKLARIDERTQIIPEMDKRIDSLEQSRAKFWGLVTGAGATGGGIGALFSKLFGN